MATRAATNFANARTSNNNKNADQRTAGVKGRLLTTNGSQRSTLGEIGNKPTALSISDVNKKVSSKKEPIHTSNQPLRILKKNKGVTSLKAVAEDKADLKKDALRVPTAAVLPQTTNLASIDVVDARQVNVQDIDANDKENPQLVSEYVNDIYSYMLDLEGSYPIRSNYLENHEINGRMRAILIDWLCQVHNRFHLLQETLYLTVAIIDRFLQENMVVRSKLQLVSVAAMLIASKYEEMYAPEVDDFVFITDNAYSRKEILQMEQIILKKLNFSFGRPLCLHFLRRDSKAGQVDAKTHTLAKYLMELTITEYDMVQYLPSRIAAAALCLSMKLLQNTQWTETLNHYSSYSEKDLQPTMQKLASLVVKAENSKLNAVRTKYSSSKLMMISTSAALKSRIVVDLAAACT